MTAEGPISDGHPMAVDRVDTGFDANAENVQQKSPAERRPLPPDRPGAEGFPSRADSHRAATAASDNDQRPATPPSEALPAEAAADREGPASEPRGHDHGRPIDASIREAGEPDSDVPEFTPEQLTQLRKAENSIRDITEKHGVHVDYTTHPIDPASAFELNKAITRMAHEYPSTFRHIGNVRTLDAHSMAESGSGPDALGHAIHKGQRPVGGAPIEPGIYLSQIRFADKSAMDKVAAEDKMRNWNVSGTAGGTLYHEFAHVIDNQLRRQPAVRNELARELKNAGVSVDPGSLSWAVPPGRKPVEVGLSRYGAANSREMIAEGFTEWKLTQNPRPIAKAIGTVIDRHFKEN